MPKHASTTSAVRSHQNLQLRLTILKETHKYKAKNLIFSLFFLEQRQQIQRLDRFYATLLRFNVIFLVLASVFSFCLLFTLRDSVEGWQRSLRLKKVMFCPLARPHATPLQFFASCPDDAASLHQRLSQASIQMAFLLTKVLFFVRLYFLVVVFLEISLSGNVICFCIHFSSLLSIQSESVLVDTGR